MEQQSPFLSSVYTADRNILKLAVEQHSFYLSKITGLEEKNIYQDMIKYIKAHPDLFNSRKAKILIKDKNEDRQVKIVPINQILRYVEKSNYHFSPSMVAYKNSEEEESINSIGTRDFIKNRSFYKNLRQVAESEDNQELVEKYDKLQNAFKIFNNAQSGAMSSEGTPINNVSGHTTLTSTTRCLTSTANLINEQFIAGNRFYNSPINTLQSITARIKVTDLKALQEVMDKYEIYYPNSEDVMNVVRRCSERYWDSDKYNEIIKQYLDRLSGLELASVLYTLDLVSLYRHNDKVITKFFDDWETIPKEITGTLKPNNGDKYVLAISKLPPKSEKELIEQLNYYHNSIETKYHDFINIFFKSSIPPTGLYDVISSIRDCVLTSDTDSSIYTVDSMIEKYTTDRMKGIRLDAVLTYFIRMISVDQHQQLSANMNVSDKNLNLLGMKNEFFFSGYVTTLMSKHYYALQRMVEGIMYTNPKMEVKGVHLKGAKISKVIRDNASEFMEKIIHSIENNEKLDPAEELFKVAELERQVCKEIIDGDWSWLTKQTIKGRSSYAKPYSSVYLYHEMWEDVFKPKYGNSPDIPYVSVKLNVELGSKKKTKEFFDLILDRELAERFERFCEKHDRFDFDTINLPMETLQAMGNIPEELKSIIDFRQIIKQNFKCIYTVLESAGLYFMNDKISRLISDEH